MAVFEDVALGFDFGEVRIGVALGNGLTASARALTIVNGRTKKKSRRTTKNNKSQR